MSEIKEFPRLKRSDCIAFKDGTRQIEKATMKMDGTLGFVCKHCHAENYIHNAKLSLETSGIEITVAPEFTVWCNNCGYSYRTREYITPNITQAVSALMKKGYEVIHASEGTEQIDSDILTDTSPMVITFTYQDSVTIKQHPPLSPWYFCFDAETGAYCHIRCDRDAPLSIAIPALMRWINNLLPDQEIKLEF